MRNKGKQKSDNSLYTLKKKKRQSKKKTIENTQLDSSNKGTCKYHICLT